MSRLPRFRVPFVSLCAPALFVLGVSFGGGCSNDPRQTNGGADPFANTGDTADEGSQPDFGGGANYDAGVHIDPTPVPDKPCSQQMFTPLKTGDPDIILIMDASGSMADGTPPKWQQVSTAITNVVSQLEMQMSPIEWGLIIFPTDMMCGVSSKLPVTVGPKHAAAVAAAIANAGPGGSTPLQAAVDAAVAYYDTLKDGRAHYLLVATDGQPNCDVGGIFPTSCMNNANCPPGQICQILLPGFPGFCGGGAAGSIGAALTQKNIRTFICGIALNDPQAEMTMDQMATLGGTARAGVPKYYPVSDQATLESTLKNITAQIISCQFDLKALPMPNQMIIVNVGGQQLPRDATHMNGWDVDLKTKTLTFYGAACTQLQNMPGVVNVGYTCPPPS